jgi:ABC-type glycerol-3-phosphate transport system substrate-binding protein
MSIRHSGENEMKHVNKITAGKNLPQAALDTATYDGKILNVPWEQNFPVILANKTKLDELGIVIPDAWTYEEFSVVCEQIKAAGIYPFANATDLNRASWLYRNAMLSIVTTEGKAAEYAAGTLSLAGSESVAALEAVKSLYDNDFMYPGAGAVTAKNDEIKAGFYQGEVLMMPEIAAGAKVTASAADFEVVAVPWPSAAAVPAINGVFNGFFIPANVEDVEVAVDVLKAFTSPEIQAIHAEEGYIPACQTVEISDPFVLRVLEQGKTIGADYPWNVEQKDYHRNQLMPDLILNGGVDTVIAAWAALEE